VQTNWTKSCYECVPKSVANSHGTKVAILWNQQVRSDSAVLNNKPHVLIRGNDKTTCPLVDFTISGNGNVIKEEADILKCQYLPIDIVQRIWNVLTVTIRAAGTITRPTIKYPNSYLEGTTANSRTGTEKVLISKYKTLVIGNTDFTSCRPTVCCKRRVAETSCVLGTRLVSGV
jgi:hypothetical protein